MLRSSAQIDTSKCKAIEVEYLLNELVYGVVFVRVRLVDGWMDGWMDGWREGACAFGELNTALSK